MPLSPAAVPCPSAARARFLTTTGLRSETLQWTSRSTRRSTPPRPSPPLRPPRARRPSSRPPSGRRGRAASSTTIGACSPSSRRRRGVGVALVGARPSQLAADAPVVVARTASLAVKTRALQPLFCARTAAAGTGAARAGAAVLRAGSPLCSVPPPRPSWEYFTNLQQPRRQQMATIMNRRRRSRR